MSQDLSQHHEMVEEDTMHGRDLVTKQKQQKRDSNVDNDLPREHTGLGEKTGQKPTPPRLCEMMKAKKHPSFEAKEGKQFHNREDQVQKIVTYCTESAKGPKSSEMKFELCGTAGTMGIGKTQLLLQVQERLKKLPKFVSVYMTFNGGMDLKGHFDSFIENSEKSGVTTSTTVRMKAFFSCVLNAIEAETKPTPDDFDVILESIRSALQISSDQTIVLLVDEIGNLGDIALEVIKGVMEKIDKLDGKVVAVFTHLVPEALRESARLSGRQQKVISLELLPLRTWKKLDDDIVRLARANKAVHQVCLSCAGHPRALFDGMPEAKRNFPPETRSTETTNVTKFRTAIIERVKFNSGDDDKIKAAVEAHLKIGKRIGDNEEYPYWIRDGVVLEVDNRLSFPFPLRVQKWAEDQRHRIDLARFLNDLFDADAELTEEYEKKMEDIMFNYEAAIREVNKGWEGSLKDYFFGTAFMDPRLRTKRVALPSSPSIEFVEDFSDGELVVQHLESGAIVVSKFRSEHGIEYMIPFFRKVKEKDENGVVAEALFVGLVQCKFTNQSKPPILWTEIKDGIHRSQGATTLKEQGVEYFPIIYTTVDSGEVKAETCKDSVVFNASNLFEFTNTLGVLRLHTEKLESVLRKKYPLLNSAESENHEN